MQGVSLLWALALLPIAAPATLNPYYVVVIPAIIHHLGHEKVCIHLSSLPETVHLAVTLEMQTQNHTLMEKDVEKPGIFECISFKVPAFVPRGKQFNEPAEEVASVHAVIHMGDRVSYEGRKKVLVRRQKTRIVIDTDKPFYKPGETVKFRIVTLDEDFKAIDKVHPLVLLQDPHGNRISQWVDVKPRQGIVDLSFPLASEAAMGKYQIKVGKDMPRGLEATFKVEEYELPKFELVFNVPPLVTTSEEEFQFTVCGRYTYGKPVQGKIEVILARSLLNLHEKEENITLSTCTVNLVNQTNKEGCAIFTVDMDELEINSTGYGNSFFIVAELEEEGTGATNMGTVTVAIATKVVEVTFVNLNPFYKLGFPYTGKMHFTINDVPIKNHTVYLTVDVNDVEMHLPYVTDEKGEVHFSLDTAKWNNTLVSLRGRYSIVNITERDLHTILVAQNEAYNWLKPFYSESNSFLEIQQVEEELPCDQEQEVRVDYILDRNELGPGADHVDFYYLVVSRGRIVLSGQTQVPVGQDETLKGSFSLTLPISSELAPSATLLVYAIFADGEVAADVDVFIVSKCFKHKVTLDFSEEEDLPGSKVNLHLKADPGSLCSVRALDKSVLLKDDRVMTPESVYNLGSEEDYMIGGRGFVYRLEDFEPYPCLPPVLPFPTTPRNRRSLMVAPWYQSEADVYSLFKQLRMKILTNTKVKKPVSCERPTYERRILHADRTQDSDNVIPLPVPQPHDGVAPSPEKEKKTKPRTHFPETWIWDLFPVGEEGKASLQATAPDTITEWQADMFCVADSGFGLSQPAKFRVFQPFFVDLTLPYSVVREEIFTLKATVFNYLKDCIQVHTSLAESPELQVESCSGCQYTSCLCANEAKTFSWNVTATKLGKVNVTVSTEALESHDLCGNEIAVTPPRGQTDTVIKSLLVKPGGVLEEKTHNVFLCATEDPVTDEVSLKLPEGVLEGSGRATVSVIGDIMGTALQNLHQLLRLPFGCGEQNMVMFAPNIFVLQYLEKTKQATTEIRNKALEFMKTGYQRQLLYKHDNGSYSAFGKHDAEGNTWLTAFVARSFGQASSYLYIDERHIQDAVRWLGQNQLPSGCFQSVGKLFNNALKGGVDDEISLTAYITAALLELHLEKNGTMVDDALLCLKKASHDVNSTYAQALMAYVFTLAKDMETRQQLLEPLDQLAGQLGGHLPQANDEDSSEEVIEDSSSSIETMAYILLTHISKPEVSAAEISATSQIVRWLTHQRNPYGGFASTQDTVVALQALARYAALTYHEAEGVKVTVQAKEGSQQEFHVDKKNQLVLQQASLPQVPGEYVVQAVGNGCAYVQTTLRYNVPPPESKATFVLDVKTAPEECNHAARKRFDLHVQVSYVGDRESSNMALIEVMMLSGFVPVKKSLKKLEKMPLVKKTEDEPSKLTIYLEELDKSPISFNFSVKQEIEVQNLKPATVTVYDYYQPGDSAITEYNAPCSSDVKKEDSQ